MRDEQIIFKFNTLGSALNKMSNSQFTEAVRMDALVQLLIDKGLITQDELQKKFDDVREEIQKKLKEAKEKPKIIVPKKEIIK